MRFSLQYSKKFLLVIHIRFLCFLTQYQNYSHEFDLYIRTIGLLERLQTGAAGLAIFSYLVVSQRLTTTVGTTLNDKMCLLSASERIFP